MSHERKEISKIRFVGYLDDKSRKPAHKYEALVTVKETEVFWLSCFYADDFCGYLYCLATDQHDYYRVGGRVPVSFSGDFEPVDAPNKIKTKLSGAGVDCFIFD